MKISTQSSSLLALAFLTLFSSVAIAAPQFSRPGEKKAANAADDSAAEKSASEKPAATTSIIKESTAKIDQQSDGWFTIVDDESRVEVRLPGKPTYKEVTFSPVAGRPAVVNHIYNTLVNKQISVDYSWMDLHEAPQGSKKVKEALDGAVKGAVVNVFGEMTRMDPVKSGNVPGREFDFEFPIRTPDGKTHNLVGYSRIFIRGNRHYQMTVVSTKGQEDAALVKKLFDSLIIKGNQ